MFGLSEAQMYAAGAMAFTSCLAALSAYACRVWPFSPKACGHPGCTLYEKPVRYCPDGHPMKAGYTGPIKSKGSKEPPPMAEPG